MADEILKMVVFCHRIPDNKDFTDRVVCIPAERAGLLEAELKKRQASGYLDTVQIGRMYIQKTVSTPYEDEVDKFLAKIDSLREPLPEDRQREDYMRELSQLPTQILKSLLDYYKESSLLFTDDSTDTPA